LLAYLFFHRPETNADVRAYEDGLRRFHAALATAQLDGFAGSNTFRVGDRYCDWYLVEGSAVLDRLNEAAVSGARSALHASVAGLAADGAGKLLRLASGTYDDGPGYEVRFSKPRGMTYSELYSRLEPWTRQPRVSLWRRMMVLGPPPEFCMLAPDAQDMPHEFGPEVVRREPL
jgi:hypothetical protein